MTGRRGARFFVGTAGWSIPRIHHARFPIEGSHLERYAAVFDGAEINSSFYRSHRRSTYERWAASTPAGFRFAVKAPKAVTHAADVTASDLNTFFAEIAGLGDKLGPILIQLPPKRSFIEADAMHLLNAFRDRTDRAIVLEPRHASWFVARVDDLLTDLKIGRVAADPSRGAAGDNPGGWAGLTYFRLHGSPHIYRSSYDDLQLKGIATRLSDAAESGSEVWCIFDNTTSYAAAGKRSVSPAHGVSHLMRRC